MCLITTFRIINLGFYITFRQLGSWSSVEKGKEEYKYKKVILSEEQHGKMFYFG